MWQLHILPHKHGKDKENDSSCINAAKLYNPDRRTDTVRCVMVCVCIPNSWLQDNLFATKPLDTGMNQPEIALIIGLCLSMRGT